MLRFRKDQDDITMALEKIKTNKCKFDEFSRGDKNLSQIIMLYTLDLHNVIYKLYHKKLEKRILIDSVASVRYR